MLAYVRDDAGKDVGWVMLKDGYAHDYPKYLHPRMREYADAERRAREAKRELWGDAVVPLHPLGTAAP